MKLKDIIGSMASKFAALALATVTIGSAWAEEINVIDVPELTVTTLDPADDSLDWRGQLTPVNVALHYELSADVLAAHQEQLAEIADWKIDWVLTSSEDLTLVNPRTALPSGMTFEQVDASSEGGCISGKMSEATEWVYVPSNPGVFELAANTGYRVLGQVAYDVMRIEAADFVKNKGFGCSLYLTTAYRMAHPNVVITLEPRLYKPEDPSESYSLGEAKRFTFGLPDAPKAVVTKNAAYNKEVNLVNVNDILSGGYQYGTVTPNVAYTFEAKDTPKEASDGAYSNWKCDYVVSMDADTDAYSIGLFGQYGWGAVAFPSPVEAKAGQKIPLLISVTKNGWDYCNIVEMVRSFTCGAINFSEENIGKTITVSLVMWNESHPVYNSYNNAYVVEEIDYRFETVTPLLASLGGDQPTPVVYRRMTADEYGFSVDENGYPVTDGNNNLVVKSFNVGEPHFAMVADNSIAKTSDANYSTADEAIATVEDNKEITVNISTTIGSETAPAGSVVTTTTGTDVTVNADAGETTVTPKTVTIATGTGSEATVKTVEAYVVSQGSGDNKKFSVVTDVSKDETIVSTGKTVVSDFVKPAAVIANAVASENLAADKVSSMVLSLVKTEAESSEPELDEALVTAIGAADKAFEVHPVATITTTTEEGTTATTSYAVANSELAEDASFTFTLDFGAENAGKFVSLTHYAKDGTVKKHNGKDSWTETLDANGIVTVTLTEFSYLLGTVSEEPPAYVAKLERSGEETQYFTDLHEALEAGKAAGSVVTLLADVDLNNEPWTPVSAFAGTFDGGNHVINNLYIYQPNDWYAGFFGNMGDGSAVRNVKFVNVNVTGLHAVGTVAGAGQTISAIENVHVSGRITINGDWYVGGIKGYGYVGKIDNCSVVGDGKDTSFVKGVSAYVGGIYGWTGESDTGSYTFSNCLVSDVSIYSDCWVGGIGGIAHYGITIENCTVRNTAIIAEDSDGDGGVGLIAGVNEGTKTLPAVLTDCVVDNTTAKAADTDIEVLISGVSRDSSCGVAFVSDEDGAYLVFSDTLAQAYETDAASFTGLSSHETSYVASVVDPNTGTARYYATFSAAISEAESVFATEGAYPAIVVVDDTAEQTNRDWKVDNGYLVHKPYVAQIGATKYTELEYAVAAVPENGAAATTIKMIADVELDATVTIPANKNVVLDLNGKTVSGSATVLNVAGTLVIDGTTSGSGISSTGDETIVVNGGTLTVDGGSYMTTGTNKYVFRAKDEATVTIDGCTTECAEGSNLKGFLRADGGSEVVINDATVNIGCQYYVLDSRGGSTITVKGGTFVKHDGREYQQFADMKQGNIAIEGGSFTFNYTGPGLNGAAPEFFVLNKAESDDGYTEDGKSVLTVSGGTFTGLWNNASLEKVDAVIEKAIAFKNTEQTCEVYVSGGTYNYNPANWVGWGTGAGTHPSYPFNAEGYGVVDNDNGTWTVVSLFEAQIVRGGAVVQKGTLAEMIAAATSGDTIQLLKDIVVTAQIVIPKSLTLDGNGHMIATTADWAVNVNNVDDGEVTIKNLTITAGSGTKRFVNVQESANLKLNLAGCTMTGCTYYAVNVRGSNSNIALNITDCNISGYCALNIWGAGGTVNVSGGTLGGVNSYSYAPGHNGNDFGVIVLNASTAPYEVTIAGTTLSAASVADSQNRKNREDIVLFNPNAANYTVRLDGCKIERSDDPSLQGLFKEEDGTSNNLLYANNTVDKTTSTTAVLPAGYAYMPADENGWMLVAEAVASVTTGGTGAGTTYYATLAAALDAAQDGETVQLLDNVTLTEPLNVTLGDKAVTLDLGGKTLAGRTNLKSGSLTIKNGTVAGGSAQALNVYGSADTAAENYSVLTIASDVTVTADVYGVCMFGETAGSNGYGAVVNIAGRVTTTGTGKEGAVFVSGNLGQNVSGDAHNVINVTGKITSATDAAIALNGLATVNVSAGAEVTGNTAIAVKRGTLNIQGGTVHATGAKNYPGTPNYNGTEMTGAAISVSDTYSQYGAMAVNVSGGTVKSDNADALFKKDGDYKADATIAVSAGSFSSAVAEEFCATGFIPKTETTVIDGVTYYTVKEGQYVAQIGANKYETLAAAIAAVPTDGTATTVTLLKGVSGETIAVNSGRNVVLDLGGHELTPSLLYVLNGALEAKNGTIKDSVYVYGLNTDNSGMSSTFTLAQDATIASQYGVILYNYPNTSKAYDATVNINGTVLGNVWVMGNITEGDSVINVAGTVDATGQSDVGIALNGNATVNVVDGAVVTSKKAETGLGTGIEVRAGTLNVTGGTISGQGSPAASTGNESGTTSAGAGIAVSTYDNSDISVNISGGTVTGYAPLYFVNTKGTTNKKLDVAVAGGTFTSNNGGTSAIFVDESEAERVVGFISGGYFSTTVDKSHCAVGYESTDAESGAPAAFKVAHVNTGYIVEKDNGEGYAVIPSVDSDWIKNNVNPDGVATTSEIEDALNTKDQTTQLKKWQAYVLNQTEPIKVTEIADTGALTTTLVDAKPDTDTRLAVTYSLVKIQGGTTNDTACAKDAFTANLETGLYKVRVHFKPTGDTSASEITVDSENTVGVLKKTTPASGLVVVPVPFKALGGNGEINVSDYIKSGLANGDTLHVYNGDNYDTWYYNGSVWAKSSTYIAGSDGEQKVSEPPAPSTAMLARGTAAILRRPEGNTDPLVFVGDYTGAAEQQITAGWNLVASPSIEPFKLKTKFTSGKIQIPTGDIPLNYTFKNGEWGYSGVVKKNGMNLPARIVVDTLPEGTGFWYISDKATTVTW